MQLILELLESNELLLPHCELIDGGLESLNVRSVPLALSVAHPCVSKAALDRLREGRLSFGRLVLRV